MDIVSFLESEFPLLKETGYQITSDPDEIYNCIAWAAGRSSGWWWPSEDDYWPEGVPRKATIDAFEAMYATLGYAPCEHGGVEDGFEKVALYAAGNIPKHAARQLPDGQWTSKLGQGHDIVHDKAEGVVSTRYGSIVRFLKRPRDRTAG